MQNLVGSLMGELLVRCKVGWVVDASYRPIGDIQVAKKIVYQRQVLTSDQTLA